MSFMQPQIVYGRFCTVTDEDGESHVYQDDYPGGEVFETEYGNAWGSRLSAPGYMDCTEWTVYETEDEAREGLADMFDLCPICLKEECQCPIQT